MDDGTFQRKYKNTIDEMDILFYRKQLIIKRDFCLIYGIDQGLYFVQEMYLIFYGEK